MRAVLTGVNLLAALALAGLAAGLAGFAPGMEASLIAAAETGVPQGGLCTCLFSIF
jgi:hypothetical protein